VAVIIASGGFFATPLGSTQATAPTPFWKLPNLTNTPGSTGYAVAFSGNATYLAVGTLSSPYLTLYSRSGVTFTKLTLTASGLTGPVMGVAFSPNNNFLAVTSTAAPYLLIYSRSSDVFTKAAWPATLPTARCDDVTFSPDGNYLAVGCTATPFLYTYKWDGDSYEKLTDPATLPSVEYTG
jgi:WD40 repeat protein